MSPSSAPSLTSLNSIKARVNELAKTVDAPTEYLPTYGTSQQTGMPHIEVDHLYYWVVCERGSELERRSTNDLDELLYWIFSSVTFTMATDFELAHRRSGEDCRRQIFPKQLEILAALSPQWASRRAEELRLVLRSHPFNDS